MCRLWDGSTRSVVHGCGWGGCHARWRTFFTQHQSCVCHFNDDFISRMHSMHICGMWELSSSIRISHSKSTSMKIKVEVLWGRRSAHRAKESIYILEHLTVVSLRRVRRRNVLVRSLRSEDSANICVLATLLLATLCQHTHFQLMSVVIFQFRVW